MVGRSGDRKRAREPRVVALRSAFAQVNATPIVFAQRSIVVRQRLDPRAIAFRRRAPGELGHERVDEFELGERRPTGVFGAPTGLRPQPYGESLGKILRRVALR